MEFWILEPFAASTLNSNLDVGIVVNVVLPVLGAAAVVVCTDCIASNALAGLMFVLSDIPK